MAAEDAGRAQTGFFCSTSGTYFTDKESLAEHYKSDFHRYNLKRKVADLPPVTKEWFEARKAQLSSTAAGTTAAAGVQQTWIDPLTKKKFNTENTYLVFVRSKKYLELVRKSGQPAPEAVIVTRQAAEAPQQAQQQEGGCWLARSSTSKLGLKRKFHRQEPIA
ncbi:Zinc finger protein [Tetrabaena socialis]|uniref:Zinc finger protein n=1 Tax=Tetrabaena socialis TaxID=47790 RepID=A0A2J7ZWX0_9CHLO|nr:Zinc finger protein [Tetrabaena socialis]|eukprot:PNH04777.1 Zinc finger protein [Tetrabaena socialis]